MIFYNLLMAMGIGACCFPVEDVQFFDELPVELVILILSYLDGKSLFTMAKTNKRLYQICKNNKQLRTTIRRHLRKERKEQLRRMLNPVKVTVLREETAGASSNAFQTANTSRRMVVKRESDFPRTISAHHAPQSSRVLSSKPNREGNISKKRMRTSQETSSITKRIRI